jgi:hypothetical protein
MEPMENFTFNLIVKLSVELGMIPHVGHFIDGSQCPTLKKKSWPITPKRRERCLVI